MHNELSLEEQDNLVKQQLINEDRNILVVANAGSGKTTFLAEKILNDAHEEKTFQKFAALTFTNNARDEITNKLKDMPQNLYVATIDGFLESEVIEPFIEQVYPNVKPVSYSYQNDDIFIDYDSGINKLRQEKIFGKYEFKIQQQGFNFKCQVAMKILKECTSAREYLTFRYKKVFIDEYQDCDSSMHDLFMYLKDELGIVLVIVGDDKQSIYQWRGASPEFINNLYTDENDFIKKRFQNNFRSEEKIVDFSLAISNAVEIARVRPKGEILYINFPFDLPQNSWQDDEIPEVEFQVIKHLLEFKYIELENNKQKFYFIQKNAHIKKLKDIANSTYQESFHTYVRSPLSDCENGNLLNALARYYFDDEYTEYHLVNELYIEYNENFIRKLSGLLKKMLSLDKLIIEEIITFLGFTTKQFGDKLESEFLLEILQDIDKKVLFTSLNGIDNIISTIHLAKGLSSDEVILFTNYLFNYRGDFDKESNYVAITRPKTKLILIDFNGKYRTKINELLQVNNETELNLENFAEMIDGVING